MINLYFGNPCDDWAIETAELMAINHNISMGRAIFIMMETLLDSLSCRDKDGFSYIDDRFGWSYEKLVFVPKINLKKYSENGINYPMMSLSKDFVVDRKNGDQLPISDKALTLFGQDFEENFGIEYLGHKWIAKSRLPRAAQTELTLT